MQGGVLLGNENFGNQDTLTAVAVFAQICVGCLTFLLSIFLGLFLPAAVGHFAAEGSFGAAFRFGEIFRIFKAAPAAYLIVLLASFVMPILALVGLAFCLIGALFTFPYAMTSIQYLYGEAYRVCKKELDFGLGNDLEPDVPPIANA
jgi:hypothetical protein